MKDQSKTELLRVFILLIGCTILFYYGMIWVQHDSKPQFNKFQESIVNQTNRLPFGNQNIEVDARKINRWEIFFEYGE